MFFIFISAITLFQIVIFFSCNQFVYKKNLRKQFQPCQVQKTRGKNDKIRPEMKNKGEEKK